MSLLVKFLSGTDYLNVIVYRGTASFTRKSCQTVLAAHLLSITRVIAPILPHLAEDVWQNLPFAHTLEDGSVARFVFDARWPAKKEKWLALSPEETKLWEEMLEVIKFPTSHEL